MRDGCFFSMPSLRPLMDDLMSGDSLTSKIAKHQLPKNDLPA
jgi:hypothetical protein